jgi:hypothetical protein
MERLFSLPVIAAAAGVVSALLLLALVWKPLQRWRHAREAFRALRAFRIERELLEARFFDLASRLGKPRGLRWLECDWLDGVTFARDKTSGLLTAFVSVNIRFEAIEGGDMEEVEAVSMVRDAAAVFHYRRGHWGTGGRVLFNMNPQDALSRLGGQFVPVTSEAELSPRG